MGTGTDATSFEASIRDASSRWMYPESETSWRRSRAKSPPISPSAPSPVDWSSAPWRWLQYSMECTFGAVQYIFFHQGVMTCRQSYSSSLHSPEMLRATLDHQKCSRVPSAPNTLPTTKNTRKGSFLCISCKHWVHTTCTTLTNTNNTQTPGPVPNVTLRPHLQSLHL